MYYHSYNVTTTAPGFHSNSIRRPRQGTGSSYLQQQNQRTNTGGRSSQRSVSVHMPHTLATLTATQGSNSRSGSSRPSLHSKGQAGRAKKGGAIDPNAEFLRPQRGRYGGMFEKISTVIIL